MSSQSQSYNIGRRLSLKGQACTVRWHGQVEGKPGEWLGVEWDDPARGKHNGTHDGKQGRSKSPTAASFLRPTQAWDQPRTFFQALTEKYMSTETHDTGAENVYFSGKQAEQVGFTKFSQRQAKLQGIHVLVLDGMRIKHEDLNEQELRTIAELCADITVLDLSSNLFETLQEVVQLCALLPKLRSLTLGGNRFTIGASGIAKSPSVSNLGLSGTLLSATELSSVLSVFPGLQQLVYTKNELAIWSYPTLSANLTTLNLSNNDFTSLADIRDLDKHCPNLQSLLLQHNRISSVGGSLAFPPTLRELSISHNAINSWSFFNDLLTASTPITSLRVSNNPLYTNLRSAEDKPLTAADGYMLTIARLPQLGILNYSTITEKERLNAETYYLGQIAVDLGRAEEGAEAEILARHPRWLKLCEEYGEPVIERRERKEEVDPRSLAARLATIDFHLADDVLPGSSQRVWRLEVPKSFDIYAVLGHVGRALGVSPLSLQLVLETGERDLAARDSGYAGPEWWDSSDEEDGPEAEESDWTTREVVMVPSTRALGTYVEGREGSIKVRKK